MPDLLLCTAVPPGLRAAHARLLTGAGLRLEEAGECTALLLADDGALLACGTRSGTNITACCTTYILTNGIAAHAT